VIGPGLRERGQDAQAAGVRYRRGQLGASHPHHAALHDGVVGANQLGEACLQARLDLRLVLGSGNGAHRGGILMAPSRRMVSPLSIGLMTMLCMSNAYSSGLPRRLGKGTCLPSESCTFCGRLAI